jgi:hypothetical protein
MYINKPGLPTKLLYAMLRMDVLINGYLIRVSLLGMLE